MHYNLVEDAAFCYTCMSAEIKGLKTIYHNKDEPFITHGYRNWRHATDVLIRLNIPLPNARGQCYDGAKNMCGIKNGVSNKILSENPKASNKFGKIT